MSNHSSLPSDPARIADSTQVSNSPALAIYTAGYQGRRPEDLKDCAERLEADVVDIRLSPFSQQPGWSKSDLQAQLGQQYSHIPALGNINYKMGGDIRIADIALGLKILLSPHRRQMGRAAILLCGCRAEETCHRAVIAQVLRDQGVHTETLSWDRGAPDGAITRLPDRSTLQQLRQTLERLHEYVIRLRCEDPPKVSRAEAFAYIQSQTHKLAAQSAEAGGTVKGWPDPEDVLTDGDQIDGLYEALEELMRPDADYPYPLPPGCWLLPVANFDVFAFGRLYNGKVSVSGRDSMETFDYGMQVSRSMEKEV